MTGAERLRMTYADYLAAEEASETKREFLRGEVFAMAGTTFEHALIAMNFGRAIGDRLAGPSSRSRTSADAKHPARA